MKIPLFLAMSPQEMANHGHLPRNLAWLGCHFSRTDRGLAGLPEHLPPGSFLILDDRSPPADHDPQMIQRQLTSFVAAHGCGGIVLDLQQAGDPRTERIARWLVQRLPCPVAVSEPYAQDVKVPVFLPPIPPDVLPREYLTPWKGREIWLDLSCSPTQITVTAQGSRAAPAPQSVDGRSPHHDGKLHCHYRIDRTDDSIIFNIHRTGQDLISLLNEAAEYGVTQAFGLYQELCHYFDGPWGGQIGV